MRDINKIIVHCTATPEGRDVSVDTIRKWHVEDNGWSDIGYHWVIELDGAIKNGRPEERTGAHAKGNNSDSIGVVYVGGCDDEMKPKDTRTDEQKQTLEYILKDIKSRHPEAKVYGHKDFSSKACPSFDAKSEYYNI